MTFCRIILPFAGNKGLFTGIPNYKINLSIYFYDDFMNLIINI